MAIKRHRPTSPGTRFIASVRDNRLYKGAPYKPLTETKTRSGGRNAAGRMTTRRRGGGHEQRYRFIDFKRAKDGITATVERLEYDPNRSARIALVCYADGERRYVIAPRGLEVGHQIENGATAAIRPGNALPLANMPIGSIVHCVELRPGKGAQLGRTAGTGIRFAGRAGEFAVLRLKSGETRRVHINCRATVGEVGNSEHSLTQRGKAGASRWRGKRPTVRGVAMNPIDHPHGGGEGRTSGGRHPVSPWGWKTKGYKTRSNKRAENMIIRRQSKRKRR
ncbi:50S ribosomal protein L2 [Salinisphaera sp. USBA-960]|uniref:50S ribosomal protein L2 n=1 Tax=Salinisphaera orenii TaxID=856731 RepID=UPI000DBE4525|nr:50S ribosomal protein L2 [Salifodinibacter halophilus]NNC26689.1 50S ribosomal protein L2 [Salifodinibacter halophilus]